MLPSSASVLPLTQAALTAKDVDITSLILDTGAVVGSVLVLLVLFSVVSWGIIIYKYLYLRNAHLQSAKFLDLFWKSRRLDQIYEGSEKLSASPIAQVFRAGYVELTKSAQSRKTADAPGAEARSFNEMGDMESVQRALRRAATSQITVLESMVSFLATTGSTAPFVGLFGTVWGIMESFHMIGKMGNATLATVAPGISEALIATATGLAAAIPAVVGYNYFVQKIKVLDAEMENFSIDFLNIIKRHFF